MDELLNNAPCGFLVFADDGKIIELNATLLKLLGYEREELTALHIEKIFSVAGRIFYQTHFFPLLKLHNKVEEVYLDLRSKTGESIPVLVNAVRRQQKERIFNDCVFVAIRQRNQYEDEILRAKKQAEAATRAKDEFLATLSHELRTPLSSILGWSRLLKEGHISGEQARRALETIERNAKSQSQLIEDLLDVSRIISGKLRLEVSPVELDSVIETAIEAVRPAAEAKNIRLQKVSASNVLISGDADRLQQIIWNLLSNAIKFTPKNGRVQIKLERVHSSAKITIADNGIGIEAETLPYVFERFHQSDSSTTRSHGGLGLGLAIVRHLVELHGGTVYAASEGLEQGSTFTATFPLIALRSTNVPVFGEENGRRDLLTHDSRTAFTCPEEIKNLRILLVDDEPDAREMLVYIFTYCKARIKGVSSVAEALKALENEEFDVIISDIGMPERDGFDLIKNIRRLPAELGGRIPALALTAYARVEDRMNVLSAGFEMHLPKPVEPAELLAVVASLARRNNYR